MWCLANARTVEGISYLSHEPGIVGDSFRRSHIVAWDADDRPLKCGWITWPDERPISDVVRFGERLLRIVRDSHD
jgi:hypothetical protein